MYASMYGVAVEIPPFDCVGTNSLEEDTAWWVV